MLFKLLKYPILLVFTVSVSLSQAPKGEVESYQIIPGGSGDTLKLNRTYGTWWYGFQGGLQFNYFFGKLNVSSTNQPGNPFNTYTGYNSAAGGGFFIGGLMEWKSIGEKWGGMLGVNFYDKRFFVGSVNPFVDSSVEISSGFTQIGISPSVKYHLPIEGLHLSAGMNLDIMLDNSGSQYMRYKNTGQITEEFKVNFKEPLLGYGLNFGIGYNYFIADYQNKARILITPFAEINIRSSMVNDNSSNWNSTVIRLGIAVKFGNDNIIYDTLEFDPTYEAPPQILAETHKGEGVLFNTVIPIEDRPAGIIQYLASSQVSAEIVEIIKDSNNKSEVIAASLPQKKAVNPKREFPTSITKSVVTLPSGKTINTKSDNIENPASKVDKKVVLYPTSSSTEIPSELKKLLDAAADYLFLNPHSRIILIGHSDAQGTMEQIATRAKERARNAEKYLLSINVPKGRIIANWKGALQGVAPNNTEEGRRQNRRVEIIIED